MIIQQYKNQLLNIHFHFQKPWQWAPVISKNVGDLFGKGNIRSDARFMVAASETRFKVQQIYLSQFLPIPLGWIGNAKYVISWSKTLGNISGYKAT